MMMMVNTENVPLNSNTSSQAFTLWSFWLNSVHFKCLKLSRRSFVCNGLPYLCLETSSHPLLNDDGEHWKRSTQLKHFILSSYTMILFNKFCFLKVNDLIDKFISSLKRQFWLDLGKSLCSMFSHVYAWTFLQPPSLTWWWSWQKHFSPLYSAVEFVFHNVLNKNNSINARITLKWKVCTDVMAFKMVMLCCRAGSSAHQYESSSSSDYLNIMPLVR